MKRSTMGILGALAVISCAVVASAFAGAAASKPSEIAVPNGFRPEGISVTGTTFYVGSIGTGAVYRGNVLTGTGAVLVPPAAGRVAIGVEAVRGQIFVAGGPTGNAYVYNASTGADVGTFDLALVDDTFINDVVVTKKFAYFTDSRQAFVYRLTLGVDGRATATSAITRIPITGDLAYIAGFNVNGIERAPSGALIVVQSNTGSLFKLNAATGATKKIDLGSANVNAGDGLLISGLTLYVVQNQLNRIAKIQLRPGLASGRVLKLITSTRFDIPATIGRHGSSLWAVNARFTTPPTPDTQYWLTRVRM